MSNGTRKEPGRTHDVVVIGAGIVGVASALALLRDGHRVTLVEAGEPGGQQAASYGNGAWISPASIVPMSSPGLWRKLPGYILDPTGPLTIRLSALPGLAPWLIRFLLAGATAARVERTARHLRALLGDAPARHAALAAEAGVAGLIRQTGLLYVYPDRAAFAADRRAWELRRANGIAWTEIDGEALRRREPDLSPRYGFGALVEAGAHCLDTGRYVAALAAHAETRNARFVRAQVTGFDIAQGRLRAVLTGDGALPCSRAVIAAGIGSRMLARAAGDRIPLVGERGYHVVVAGSSVGPRTPLMPSDGKMANTPTRAGLRASGQVELARPNAAADWHRAEILLAHLRGTFPGLSQDLALANVSTWMGQRPSTPDGLPVIGRSRATADVLYAFGHGHVGFAAGPATGDAVADLMAERPPALPPAFAPGRFRGRFSPTA
jgi:D-amino-acid dehydrogenase